MEKYKQLFLIVLTICSLQLHGQDLATIGEKDPIKISGGISANQIFYGIKGEERRRDPYSYYLSGNMNFDIYGLAIPLSYSYSNNNSSFQQPFNQFSLSPTYKWATLYLGFNSMSFSQYTLNGHLFNGIGLEVNPTDKINVKAMYGRLRKAVEFDPDNSKNQPAYKRKGYGLSANFKIKNDILGFSFFSSKDFSGSIHTHLDSLNIFPEENISYSLTGKKFFAKKIFVEGEYAASALTRNTYITGEDKEVKKKVPFRFLGPVFKTQATTSYYSAYKLGLGFREEFYTLGVNYERIDPGYKTHGAYYFNDNLQNVTINIGANLLQQKLTINGNLGMQKDNLDGKSLSNMSRTVGSVSVACMLIPKTLINLSYSGFKSYTHIRSVFDDINKLSPYDNLDTLDFTQISENYALMTNYTIKQDEESRQMLMVSLNYQKASDKQKQVKENTGINIYTISSAYSYGLLPLNLTVSVMANYNRNEVPDMRTEMWGPTIALNKAFLEKTLRSTISFSYNKSYLQGKNQGAAFNMRLNNTYKIKKQHMVNLSLMLLNRNVKKQDNKYDGFTEYTVTLGYSYNF